MQVYPNKLDQTLTQNLAAMYLVFGDEPQQKMVAMDAIRAKAKAAGFAERTVLVADSDFQWQQLANATQSMSLFCERQLIELELPTGKPGKEGGQMLLEVSQQANPDILLLVHGPRIGKDVQRTKWFSALDKCGVYVPCYPLEGRKLQQWLQQASQALGCTLTIEAASLLADCCEGNMLAGAQEVQKLALLFENQQIDEKMVASAVVNQSRHTVFQLVDMVLAGDSTKAAKLLLSLESEGLEPHIILWALVREWQTLTQIKQQTGSVNWNALRIWGQRQQYYQTANNRLSPAHLAEIGAQLGQADITFKQQTVARPYVALFHLCLIFIQPSVLATPWNA